MFCCVDWGISTNSSYPGRRAAVDGYSGTGGNALSKHADSNYNKRQTSNVQNVDSESNTIGGEAKIR